MIDSFITSSSSSHSSNATPPCLQWARTLSNLLEDREGEKKNGIIPKTFLKKSL